MCSTNDCTLHTGPQCIITSRSSIVLEISERRWTGRCGQGTLQPLPLVSTAGMDELAF